MSQNEKHPFPSVPVRPVRQADAEFMSALKRGARLFLGPEYRECTYEVLTKLVEQRTSAAVLAALDPWQRDMMSVGMAMILHWYEHVRDKLPSDPRLPLLREPPTADGMSVRIRCASGYLDLPGPSRFPPFLIEQRPSH
jgi:hypothetical protein